MQHACKSLIVAGVLVLAGCHPAAEDADVHGPAPTQQAEREAQDLDAPRDDPQRDERDELRD